jgi:hypothetical protein
LQKKELSFSEMDQLFKKLGTKVNRSMLQLIFSLFDADNSGTVDKTEFLVSITFLSKAQATKDVIELAFLLFDSNRSGAVNKEEFAAMCLAMMNKAKFVLGIPVLRAAFRKHLEADYCVENLDFYEALEKCRDVTKQATFARRDSGLGEEVTPEVAVIPVAEAKKIFEQFVREGAPTQVNLSYSNRRRVEEAISNLSEDAKTMDSAPFDQCIAELLNMIETDSMSRFKEKIRQDGLWLSDQVWMSEKIKGPAMTKEVFKKWAKKNPNMFTFLVELQHTLRKALHRQKIRAAMVIQRAYRARLRAKLQNVITEVVAQAHSPHGQKG